MVSLLASLLPVSLQPNAKFSSISQNIGLRQVSATADSFVNQQSLRIPQILNDPVFTKLGLTPSIAQVADYNQVAKASIHSLREKSDSRMEAEFEVLQKRSDKELILFFSKTIPGFEKMSKLEQEVVTDNTIHILRNKEAFMEITRKIRQKPFLEEDEMRLTEKIKSRYSNSPNACMVVLKNKKGEIVAFEGLNPFQKNHDFLVDLGDFSSINPKHGLLNYLYVKPEYRKQGIATALKKSMIRYARDIKGYEYVWAPTEQDNPSHFANKKLGFIPLTLNTRFKDAPEFTPELVKALMDEYNVGNRQLAYLETKLVK